MEKDTLKNYRRFMRGYMRSVDATKSQLDFLIEQYSDVNSVVGIHNTDVSYENFFETGLRNQTSMYKNTSDLSNTVFYSKMLSSLAIYPNGDGKRRAETAIILKIPNEVFTHEQGIFETLPDGRFGIPSQFIVGAFADGEVIQNPNFQAGYNNPDAIKCNDPDYVVNEKNNDVQIEAFKMEYEKYQKSIKHKIANFMERLKRKHKYEELPPAENEQASAENEHQAYIDELRNNTTISNTQNIEQQAKINKQQYMNATKKSNDSMEENKEFDNDEQER